VELRNIADNTINLAGVEVVNGIVFESEPTSALSLEPGEYAVIVLDQVGPTDVDLTGMGSTDREASGIERWKVYD
jgi:hypothetical protein